MASQSTDLLISVTVLTLRQGLQWAICIDSFSIRNMSGSADDMAFKAVI
jgi:hypothetical protein